MSINSYPCLCSFGWIVSSYLSVTFNAIAREIVVCRNLFWGGRRDTRIVRNVSKLFTINTAARLNWDYVNQVWNRSLNICFERTIILIFSEIIARTFSIYFRWFTLWNNFLLSAYVCNKYLAFLLYTFSNWLRYSVNQISNMLQSHVACSIKKIPRITFVSHVVL